MKHYGIDWAKEGSDRTVILIVGGRGYGKSFFIRLWLQYHFPDLISKQLIRKLAAEAIITISINN